MDPELARKGTRIAVVANATFFFGAVILVPFTLFGTSYVYSKLFFTGWVVVPFIWIWMSVLICVVYPVVSEYHRPPYSIPCSVSISETHQSHANWHSRSKVWGHCGALWVACGAT